MWVLVDTGAKKKSNYVNAVPAPVLAAHSNAGCSIQAYRVCGAIDSGVHKNGGIHDYRVDGVCAVIHVETPVCLGIPIGKCVNKTM